MSPEPWLALDQRGLASALAAGHPLPQGALDGWRYHGLSLGLPGWVERLSWKTFAKDFHRDPATGACRGWNVRLEQTGWGGTPRPRLGRDGRPVCFGHFAVRNSLGGDRALPVRGCAVLDYGAGGNRRADPVRLLRDPLVAVHPGSPALLLGCTWLQLGPWTVGTPSYFLLRQAGRLDHVVSAPSSLDPPDP